MHTVAKKRILEKCKPHAIAYCPTMDLVALATDSENLHVFRLNGQRVFGASYEGSGFGIAFIRWKSNGQLLAVACTDKIIRLISSFSGKSVHQLPILPLSADAALSCLGWAVNFTNSATTKKQIADAGDKVSLDDLLSLNAQVPMLLKSKANLPRDLTLIDVEASLPKLSTLPSTGGDDDIFSTRASVDAIFHAPNRNSQNEAVDVLLMGFDDASIHLRIFDCFEIGSISLASSLPGKSNACTVTRHAFHPFTSTHALIVQSKSASNTTHPTLHILSLDLNFIPSTAPYYLPLLASKSTQLQNLLRYLSQIQTQLAFEVKSAFDLPSKYLRNINETLSEHNSGADFVMTAYHLVVTGECIPQLREWLVDEVGERGLKRWEKSILVGMETMRRLVHECLLPALERCHVVISRLEGLSRFQKSAQVLGLETKALTLARDTVDCLNLLAHDLLKVLGKEVREFGAFLKWIRLECEVQSLEVGSERAEELREGSDALEYRVVLDYISGAMSRSCTLDFIRPAGSEKSTSDSAALQDEEFALGYYETYKKIRKSRTAAEKSPKLDDLVERLKGQCAGLFLQIAETLRKSILHSHLANLPRDCDPEVLEMRISPNEKDDDAFDLRVAAKQTGSKAAIVLAHLRGNRSRGTVVNFRPFGSRSIPLPEATEVQDVKFVDDVELMVLAKRNVSKLFSIDVTGETDEWHVRHSFNDEVESNEKPARLEVNGRKGRRVVCVLDETGKQYTILDLDQSLQDIDEDQDKGNANDDDEIMAG